MRLQGFINERDIALIKIEDCAKFKGEDAVKCKIKKYEEYIRDLEDALSSSTSSKETKSLKASEKDAKTSLFNLRTTEKEMRKRK